MVCIYCSNKTEVINSRSQKRANSVWRRRHCLECDGIFTTVEAPDLTRSLLVRIDTKHVEAFSRDKLLLSVYDSLRHRKTAVADAESLTATIIGRIYALVEAATIDNTDITATVTQILKRFDKVAATHYTAFHPGAEV